MMKALQIFILFAIISGALAIADVDEITALLNIRNHVRPLDERWPEEAVRHACDPNWYLHFITCTGDHVTEMYVIWSTCLYISSFMSTCSCIPPNTTLTQFLPRSDFTQFSFDLAPTVPLGNISGLRFLKSLYAKYLLSFSLDCLFRSLSLSSSESSFGHVLEVLFYMSMNQSIL